MSKSEVFENYAKIAEEAGLVSSAVEDSRKIKKYKKEQDPRLGSDDISTIEALYGVKPDNSVKYEENIMEAAHKAPVVIAPSYDKTQALVENEIERQKIDFNIVMGPLSDGSNAHTYKKYAEKELVLQLVRIANDMDNSGSDELRVLADNCLAMLKKKANFLDDIEETAKGAGTGAAIGGVIGGVLGAIFGEGAGAIPGAKAGLWLGGAAGGIAAALLKTGPQAKSISFNAEDAKSQLEDLRKKVNAEQEVLFLQEFESKLDMLSSLASQYNALIAKIQLENLHEQQSNADQELANTTTVSLKETIQTIEKYHQLFLTKVKSGVYSEADAHSKLLTPIYYFIDTDVEDATKSLDVLSKLLNDFNSTLSSIATTAQNAGQNSRQQVENFKAPIHGDWASSGGFTYQTTSSHPKGHMGVDMRAAMGTPVYPLADGIVSYAGTDPLGGNVVNVQHENGLRTYYAHLSSINVEKGQKVSTNDVLGTVGMSGNAAHTVPHLHFQVWQNGQIQDPANFFSVPAYTDERTDKKQTRHNENIYSQEQEYLNNKNNDYSDIFEAARITPSKEEQDFFKQILR
jgi:murein DD-endopeptidase MepM/ murein hydrolase activator NlpD